MTERAQKLKAIVKGTAPQATYGTNPMDPWSAKANMAEDATLNKYLMSRGINPKYATKDQKVAHSKTGAFITWKKSRMLEDTLEERVDKKDTVTLDIPLLIRIMELAREDIKTDMDLHRVVEKLINIRNKGMLTMKDYNYISKIHEEVMSQVSQEVIDEVTTTGYHKAAVKSRMDAAVKVASSMGKDKQATTKLNARNAGLKRLSDRTSAEMKKANSGPQKPIPSTHDGNDRGYGKGRYMGDSVEHDDEVVAEAQSAAVRWQKALEAAKKKREEETARNAENAKRALTPKTMGESSERTKSARIIKSLYKRKGVAEGKEDKIAQLKKDHATAVHWSKNETSPQKREAARQKAEKIKGHLEKQYKQGVTEELYDHEKEDKSVATYGKKPKVVTNDPKASFGENKPEAAAILTGGTTLTGEKRDTIEIDPMMRKRPGSDPKGKNKET